MTNKKNPIDEVKVSEVFKLARTDPETLSDKDIKALVDYERSIRAKFAAAEAAGIKRGRKPKMIDLDKPKEKKNA